MDILTVSMLTLEFALRIWSSFACLYIQNVSKAITWRGKSQSVMLPPMSHLFGTLEDNSRRLMAILQALL
jgi:hypothetical protein